FINFNIFTQGKKGCLIKWSFDYILPITSPLLLPVLTIEIRQHALPKQYETHNG
ncbi:hypothetical protein ACJX0J_016719, partial [Zea mays]